MKLLLTFISIGAVAIMTTTILNMNSNPEENKIENSSDSLDSNMISTEWFETNLGMHIPKEYQAFTTDKYKQPLSEGAKDTLSFEYWLGNFKIVDMDNHGDFTTVNLSSEIHNRFLFITSDYFVLTSYMEADQETGLTYGSSAIYLPETNTLKELDSIIVLGVYKDKLIGSLEHDEIGEQPYVEQGFYDIKKEKFIVKL
jgi:hypothetical protein